MGHPDQSGQARGPFSDAVDSAVPALFQSFVVEYLDVQADRCAQLLRACGEGFRIEVARRRVDEIACNGHRFGNCRRVHQLGLGLTGSRTGDEQLDTSKRTSIGPGGRERGLEFGEGVGAEEESFGGCAQVEGGQRGCRSRRSREGSRGSACRTSDAFGVDVRGLAETHSEDAADIEGRGGWNAGELVGLAGCTDRLERVEQFRGQRIIGDVVGDDELEPVLAGAQRDDEYVDVLSEAAGQHKLGSEGAG